jgi:two-component system sensor histidine kinase KdpD
VGGVGLGLWVARGFTEAMDGTLIADRAPGGGLLMRLRLPLADGAAAPAKPAEAAPGDSAAEASVDSATGDAARPDPAGHRE